MSSKSMISLLALLLLSRTSAVPTGAVPTELANEGTCANGANGDGTCAAVPKDDALHLLQTKIELTLKADHAKGARAEADHAKGARAEADHAKGARAEEEDDDARAQEGEEDDAGAKAPTLHPVASCNQCAQSWCDASRPPEINDISVGASKGVIGSTLAAWGCDKVSSSTTIWRNSASGVVYAVEQAQAACADASGLWNGHYGAHTWTVAQTGCSAQVTQTGHSYGYDGTVNGTTLTFGSHSYGYVVSYTATISSGQLQFTNGVVWTKQAVYTRSDTIDCPQGYDGITTEKDCKTACTSMGGTLYGSQYMAALAGCIITDTEDVNDNHCWLNTRQWQPWYGATTSTTYKRLCEQR